MSNEYIKIFTGSAILTNRLKGLLSEVEISSIVRDEMESGRLAGFGAPMNSSELFVLESDLEKAKPIANDFLEEIDS